MTSFMEIIDILRGMAYSLDAAMESHMIDAAMIADEEASLLEERMREKYQAEESDTIFAWRSHAKTLHILGSNNETLCGTNARHMTKRGIRPANKEECMACNLLVLRSEWKHSYRASSDSVKCTICGAEFDNYRGLNGHMNAHIPSSRKRAEDWRQYDIMHLPNDMIPKWLDIQIGPVKAIIRRSGFTGDYYIIEYHAVGKDYATTKGPYPYTKKGWFNGYMRWKQVPVGGKSYEKEVQAHLGDFIDTKIVQKSAESCCGGNKSKWNSEDRDKSERMTREVAEKLAEKVVKMVSPDVDFVEVCGSYRRGRKDPGDLDVVIILKEGITLPEIIDKNKNSIDAVNWLGEKKAQTLIDGHKVDFRTTNLAGKGAALLYFTGPAGYNIGMRRRAKKMGLKLNEYGVWDRNTNQYLGGATEEEVYKILGKTYKSPVDRKGAESFDAEGHSYYHRNKAMEAWRKNYEASGILEDKVKWNRLNNLHEKYESQGFSKGESMIKAMEEMGVYNQLMKGVNVDALLDHYSAEYIEVKDSLTSDKLHQAKNWPLIKDRRSIGRRYIQDVKLLNSWEEWEALPWYKQYEQWYYINWPCTVYRGSKKTTKQRKIRGKGIIKGIDYERYYGQDEEVMKPSGGMNQGYGEVIAAAPGIKEALDYADITLHSDTHIDKELYALDIQDYIVIFPRPSRPDRLGRLLPVVMMPGGVYLDDAILLWDNFGDFDSENTTVWNSDKSKVFDAVALFGSTQKEFRGEPLGSDGW